MNAFRTYGQASAAVATIACLFLSAAAGAQQKITLGMVAAANLAIVPIAAAKDLGFFKEEGLDVDLVEFNGTATLLPQMTAKRVQVGYANPDVLIISRQPGKDPLPLKFFYNMVRESSWEFAVPAASPVQQFTDLRGKKVGVYSLTSGNIPITKAMFKELGTDVDLVPVGLGATATLAFKEGKIDALNLWDTQHATLEAQGIPIRRLPMGKKYLDLFSNGLVAHEDTIRNAPKMLASVGRAFAKTTVFCEANRTACVRAFWRVYPNQKPTGDEAKALAEATRIMATRFDKFLSFEDPRKRRWGEYSGQVWSDFVATLYGGGQLTTRDIPVDSLYTNALVPEFNNFDPAPIIARAKADR